MISNSSLNSLNLIPASSTTTTTTNTAEDDARARAEKEKVDFLSILLTQIANQNPLDPMDNAEFSAQLTRYSILEQGIQTNENLAVTNTLLKENAVASSFSYIGKQVELDSNINVAQKGKAEWSYIVDGNPDEVKLTITDGKGNRLGEFDGSVAKGVHSFTFDAATLDVANGTKLYMSVNAKDGETSLKSKIASLLTIDGVQSDGKNSYFTAGEVSFTSANIKKIIETSTTTPTTI